MPGASQCMMDEIKITADQYDDPEKLGFTSATVPDPASAAYEDPAPAPALGPHDLDHYSYDKNDPPATKKELYSYYAYYAGNNGIGSFQ
jgi:hypothetical protein